MGLTSLVALAPRPEMKNTKAIKKCSRCADVCKALWFPPVLDNPYDPRQDILAAPSSDEKLEPASYTSCAHVNKIAYAYVPASISRLKDPLVA